MAITQWTGNVSSAWATAGNWTNGVPTSGDTVIIKGSDTNVNITASDQSATQLALLQIDLTYTGLIGSDSAYLQVGADVLTYGLNPLGGATGGSGRINIDTGSSATTFNIYNSANSATDTNQLPLRFLNSSSASVLYLFNGKVAIATGTNETANIPTIIMGQQGSNPTLVLGEGCEVDAYTQTTGNCTSLDNITTPNKTYSSCKIYGGTFSAYGSSLFTSLDIQQKGQFNRFSDGTITLLQVGNATFDTSSNPNPITITDTMLYLGGILNLKCGKTNVITFTNPVQLINCRNQDISIQTELGQNVQFS